MILPARSARCLLLALGPFLGCASAPRAPQLVTAPPAVQPAPAAPALLEKGIPVEREIREGETHEYRIAINAGDYARVTVDQTKADVAVRLVGADGEEIATVDGVGGRREPELVSWIGATGGDCRLQITSRESTGSGPYKVTLEDLRPSTPGDADRLKAEKISNEASHLRAVGDSDSLRKAAAKLEESLALWTAAGDTEREIETLSRIGAIHRFLGETEVALSLYERALTLAREVGDEEGEAKVRNNLGVARQQLGQNQQAAQDFQDALRLWEKLGRSDQIATTSYNLGSLQFAMGDMESALSSYQRALEIRRAAGDEETQSKILTGIGSIYRDRGDGDKALELYAEALDLSRRTRDRDAESVALHNMASTYLAQGDFQRALDLYTAALELQQKIGNRELEALLLYYLGSTSLHLGDSEQALKFYDRSLQIHREIGGSAWEAYVLRDIGWVYQGLDQPQTALEKYTQAYEISRKIANRRGEAASLHGMGRANLNLEKPKEAVRLLEQSVQLFRETEDAIGEINSLLDLGRALEATSEPRRAEEHFEHALDLSRRRQALLTEAIAQSAIAKLKRDQGDLASAAAAIGQALEIIESIRPKVASQRQKVSFFASRRDYYDFYIDVLMRMYEQQMDTGSLFAALAASERARARALLDLLSEGRIDLFRGISPDLKRREKKVGNRISFLQSQLLEDLAQRGSRAALIDSELEKAEQEKEEVEAQIKRDYPHYAALHAPDPLLPERIQQLLDDRTAFLEYAVGTESSYLFVVTRQRLAGYRLPGADELAAQVEGLRELLREPGRRHLGRYADLAYGLYTVLLAPAAEALQDKPRLIISPDGPLLLLSFEALLTDRSQAASYDGLPFLIRDRAITYVPSASVFAELRSKPAEKLAQEDPGPFFLAFADPTYVPATAPSDDAFDLRSFRRLPGARREVEDAAALYSADQVKVYFEDQVTKKNIKENPELGKAQRIHFAVHGLMNETRPELSGLVLSDGLLQVDEIFNLELNADLVVLSACEMALGKNVKGEGLLGVSRALLYAGAASVVVSFWQVADETTPELMLSFYQELDRGIDKAEALRLSKLKLIEKGRQADPYYWAPFIMIGQPGSAVTSRQFARQ